MPAVSSFNTHEIHPSGNTPANVVQTVEFPQHYVAPPRLSVGLNMLHMKTGANARLNIHVEGVDKKKYVAHVETWWNTTLHSAGADVLILKPSNLEFQSGEYRTDYITDLSRRQNSRRINFDHPFVTPPKVLCYLKYIDIGSETSIRIKSFVSDIDVNGFTIHVNTWDDTTLYCATASWVAYPADKDYIVSGTADTMDVRSVQIPQLQTHKDITFQGVSFLKKPSVFVALNTIDISASKDLRIRAYVDNVTTGGLTWHIDSWSDSQLWGAGISYIAFH